MGRVRTRRGLLRAAGLGAAALAAGCGRRADLTTTRHPTIRPMRAALALSTTAAVVPERLATAFEAFRSGGRPEYRLLERSSSMYDAGGDPGRQASQIETAVDGDADLVVLDAIDDPRVRSAAGAAADAGVPVIALGEPTPPRAATRLTVDEWTIGGQAGVLLYGLLKETDPAGSHGILEVAGRSGSAAVDDRRDGLAAFVGQHDTFESVGAVTAGDSPYAARTAVAGRLSAIDASVDGVLAHSPRLAVGVHRALAASDRDSVCLVAVGETEDWFRLVAEHRRYGAVLLTGGAASWYEALGGSASRRAGAIWYDLLHRIHRYAGPVPPASGMLWTALQSGAIAASGRALDDATEIWGEAVVAGNVGAYGQFGREPSTAAAPGTRSSPTITGETPTTSTTAPANSATTRTAGTVTTDASGTAVGEPSRTPRGE